MIRNRVLLALSLAVSIAFIGIGMVVPVRVLYAQSRGASLAIIGAMASSFLLSSFVFQYPVGWLADLWGRKPVMLAGLAAQSLLSLVYLAVTDPVLFVVLRFLEGMAATSMLPAARALIADSVAPEQRGEAYGIFGSFMNAGFLLGPALGGVFAAVGYTSAFVGSCVFRAMALVIVLTLVQGEGRTRVEDRERARTVPRRLLFTLPLVGAYILYVGDSIFFGFDLTLLPLWMRHNLGAPVAAIGLAYTAWALPNVLTSPFGGRLADRARRSTLIAALGLAQVPIYLALGLVTLAWPVVLLFAVHGVVYGLMQPSVDATLAAASPPNARARAQSVYVAAGLASAFIAANVLSWLYGVDFRIPLFVMGGGFGVCLLVGVSLIRFAERRRGVLGSIEKAVVAE